MTVDLDSNLNELDEYRMHLYGTVLYYTFDLGWPTFVHHRHIDP